MIINFESKEKKIWFYTSKVIAFVLVVLIYSLMIIGAYNVEAKVKSEKQQSTSSSDDLSSLNDYNRQYEDVAMNKDDFLFDEISSDVYYEYYYGMPMFSEDEENADDTADAEELSDSDMLLEDTDDENSDVLTEESEDILSDDVEHTDILEADLSDWRLVLVNKQNPVPDDYEFELANISPSYKADARIIDAVRQMLEASVNDGVHLSICSAYRSYERQIALFNNKMNKLMQQGMSYMDAYRIGSMSVTVPGTSEHQIGLALDILSDSYYEMDDGFGETEEGIWLRENAPDYGFILRYPEGKENITGIIYEPWHFRYVGVDYAKQITELGICLEEYVNGDY